MTENREQPNFNDYRSMMGATHAPARLQRDVLTEAAALREQEAAAQGATVPEPRAFAVKRTRMKGLAVAACAVLALGAGALALSPLAQTVASNGGSVSEAPASGNFFQMVAFADESAQQANGPVALSVEDFTPVRTGAGPRYDAKTDSYPGEVDASRSYNLNLTCTGNNIASLTYELQGEGVSFYSWQLTDATLSGSLEIGDSMAEGGMSSSFTVDYDNQDMSAVGDVHHEICLEYTLDGTLKEAWDEFHASTPHVKVPGIMPEDERLAAVEAQNQFDLVLAKHDAEIISQAKLVLTATFTDGTTATKTYRLAPVENFEQAYSDYLAARMGGEDTREASRLALYTLEEVG